MYLSKYRCNFSNSIGCFFAAKSSAPLWAKLFDYHQTQNGALKVRFNIHSLVQDPDYFNIVFRNHAIENQMPANPVFVISLSYIVYFDAVFRIVRQLMERVVQHFQIEGALTSTPVFLRVDGDALEVFVSLLS